jgi:hypothetical protein
MTSLRQRYANRLNARASAGPRTAAGKARAAQNARKHGLRVPALRDPEKTRNIAELARKLAGPTADAQRFEAACRLVAAQIDLLDIREARLPLLARALEDRAAVKCLATLDRYESDARSLRKSAGRKLAAARAAASTGSGETILNETSDNEIDIAAVLRRLSRKSPAFGSRVGKGSRRAGFDTFRKRSQVPRTKPNSKNPTKTKLQGCNHRTYRTYAS